MAREKSECGDKVGKGKKKKKRIVEWSAKKENAEEDEKQKRHGK